MNNSDRVECPVCGGKFAGFAPVSEGGGGKGPRTRCPACGARERNRHLWLYLRDRTNLFSDDLRVLHFAPERIFEQRLKTQSNLRYVNADLRRPRAMVHADITEIPFADDSFDVILCSHVLEHVTDDRKAMRELRRVLRPDGWALLLVPISSRREVTVEDPTVVDPEERTRLFGQFDHVRVYGQDFVARLQEAGFHVRVEDYGQQLGEALARRYGLRPRAPRLHLCFKSAEAAERPAVSCRLGHPARLEEPRESNNPSVRNVQATREKVSR